MNVPSLPSRFGLPLAMQLIAILVCALLAAQFVTLGLTVLLPPAAQPRWNMDEVAAALSSDRVADRLERKEMSGPPNVAGQGWLVSQSSREALAQRLGRQNEDVVLAFYTALPVGGVAVPSDSRSPLAAATPARSTSLSSLLVESAQAQSIPGGPPPGGGSVGPGGLPGGGFPGGHLPGGGLPGGSRPGGGAFPGGSMPRPSLPTSGVGTPSRPSLPSHGQPGQGTTPTTPGNTSPGNTSPGNASGNSPGSIPGGIGAGGGITRPGIGAPGIGAGAIGGGGIGAPGVGNIASPSMRQMMSAPVSLGTAPDLLIRPSDQPSETPVRIAQPRFAAAPTQAVPSLPAHAAGRETSTATAGSPALALAEAFAVNGTPQPVPFRREHASLFDMASPPFIEGDFIAAARQSDGRWLAVAPRAEPFPNAWQKRVMLWFALSLAIVSPLAWLFARRIVVPLRDFARAAEQLGRDPSATILPLSGPAEIGRAAYAFNQMRNRLRSFVDDRTAMVGAISHDLRTPLTRLRFRIEDVPDAQRGGLLREVSEMEAMISQVIDFIRDASTPGPRERVDFAELVAGSVADARLIGADVEIERTANIPVDVDAVGIRRLLGNLLENAVKYGENARVRVSLREGEAVAEILDSGPGIPEEEFDRAFEPFYRSDAARNSGRNGSGLGLTVCRSIARAHGGDVSFAHDRDGFVARLSVPAAFNTALRKAA
ncbi:integral membrane sensor signal transduction histidine kinase [Novosphingobium sp. Rr 2-17]|uniref:ATP-binding protein n=1 Tax=Novosphingobium sp. Rr 2-17 TaxID=555793 RepID=UPI0002697EC6|nr:ATP-binding protein [Novosphingobium sp. Rr 2-17]EIZ79001.1 integral membrane sensor signal transduction histidine kinase [Novosphingobium sp. Rr 2-17]